MPRVPVVDVCVEPVSFGGSHSLITEPSLSLMTKIANLCTLAKECQTMGIENFHIEINGANAALLSDKKTLKIIRDGLKQLYRII